jgi:histidyl-tRNA synthetase
LSRTLRGFGIECVLEFKERSLKNQLSRANKQGAAWGLIIGENEVKKDNYQLKNMNSGEQLEVREDEIPGLVQHHP